MARIPDEEIERLKREIPIERLVTGFGIDLKQGKGWLLVFENADGLLRLPMPQLSTFLSVLSDTAAFWKDEGHSFRVVLAGSQSLAAVVEATGFSPTPA